MTTTTRTSDTRARNSTSTSPSPPSPSPSSPDMFSRFIKRYKIICLILVLLLLTQIFIYIRVVLISNYNHSNNDHQTLYKNNKSQKLNYDGGSSSSSSSSLSFKSSNKHDSGIMTSDPVPPPQLPADLHFKQLDEDLLVKESELDEKDSMEHLKSDVESIISPVQLNQSSISSTPTSQPSLNLSPTCQITSKESLSAIQRAKTQHCKDQLTDIACSTSLYPVRLPRFCKNNENTYMKHIGCYRDDQKNRLLPNHFALLKISNSPQNCVDLCLQSGFGFAGVQYSIECFCGNSRPSENLIIPSDECNMKCPSIPSNTNTHSSGVQNICGGYFTMNVYETGIFNLTRRNDVKGLEDIKSELSGSTTNLKKKVGIVFFLTLNGRAVRQVIRLIKTLFRKQHYFYIHVDARQDYLFRELQILNDKLPNNVHFMEAREGTIWGGASLLNVLLNGMKDLIHHSKDWGWEWDFVINLSESDFPLKAIEQLEAFLALNNKRNFIKSHGHDVQKFITKQGLDKTFVECEYRMWRLGDRKLPSGILIDGGSDWIALHHDFIDYIVQTDDELVSGLKIVFKHTLLPAETFFHTVLRNSQFCETFVDNNLHVTNWKRKLGCKCQYRDIVDWCGCSPNDFRLADWNRLELTESRLIFFGRKFESIVNQAIINRLELKLHPDHHDYQYSTLDKFWLNIYHHRDALNKQNDAILTLGHSLARLTTKKFVDNLIETHPFPSNLVQNHECEIHVEEMNVFAQNDRMEGILVKFETHVLNDLSVKIESWYKLQPGWVEYVDEIRNYRFHNIRIGENYDQKEQIFRNYAGILGPFSKPTIAYNVHTDKEFNISFVWISPDNKIKNIMNVSIGVGETANFVKPVLKAPLMPGNWTVNLQFGKGNIIASAKFLISPLEFYDGQLILFENLQDRSFDPIYENISHLQSSIDSYLVSYYEFQDFCVVNPISQVLLASLAQASNNNNNKNHYESQSHTNRHHHPNSISSNNNIELQSCRETAWSSLYPDPKGSIESVDVNTGLLLP